MHEANDDAWSPRPSDVSSYPSSSYASDADDELDDKMSRAGTSELDESTIGSEGGRNSPSPSVYSYHSSVDGGIMLREIHGRTFNNTSEHYMLPADVTEHSRLDLQHELLNKIRGGLFYVPRAVKKALAAREGSQPSILDIGSGSGSWVIEMGRQFPHAEVVGLDLAPANLSSYRKFMDEVVEILRPGGVYLTVEGDMQLHDENRNPLPLINEGEPGFTYTVRIFYAILEAMRARGPGIDTYPKIYGWLQDQGTVWESVGQKMVYIPLGAWDHDASPKDRKMAELMGQDIVSLIPSVRPMLLSYGWFDETVDKWSTGAQEEIKSLKNKFHIRWYFTWAIKPGRAT
ncbi:hypothetical protein FS837_012705 [Tulasnella sp. UAMH 9824]|nr:hypothetical protein FS837_012705 [Tulasnella sp. UAMH 9824]